MKHRTLLRRHRERLGALASAWLDEGASLFEVLTEDEVLLRWAGKSDSPGPVVTIPIEVAGKPVARLRVTGWPASASRARLTAEAALLAELIGLEDEMELMTSDLVNTQDRLLSLYKLAQMSHQHVGTREVLRQLNARSARLFRVGGLFAMAYSPVWGLQVEQLPGALLDEQTLEDYLDRFRAGEEEILWNGEEVKDAVGPPGVENLLVVAVDVHDGVVVGLGLINKRGDDGFSVPDIRLAQAIVEHGGAQIENILLYEQTLQQARLETEMSLAQSVQLNLLPKEPPVVRGLELWAESRPASQVGGDFYDFVLRPEQSLVFTVGDVSGKGMPAAMLMAMTRSVMRSNIKGRAMPTPAAVIGRSNTALYSDFAHVGMFTTAFVGQYNPATRELLYANAGHSPVIYYPAGGRARMLTADGTPMGILPTTTSDDKELTLKPGDVLVVATDGFSEAYREGYEMFGYDRLLDLVEMTASSTAREISDTLYETVHSFSGDEAQGDDQTLVVLKGVE